MDAFTWGAPDHRNGDAAELKSVSWPRVGLVFEPDSQTGWAVCRRIHGYVPDDAEDNGEPAIHLAAHELARRAAGVRNRLLIMPPYEFELFVATRHIALEQLNAAASTLGGYRLTLPIGGGNHVKASWGLDILVLPRLAIATLAKRIVLEGYKENPDGFAFLLKDETFIKALSDGTADDLRAAS
jgi:hypothetical protein